MKYELKTIEVRIGKGFIYNGKPVKIARRLCDGVIVALYGRTINKPNGTVIKVNSYEPIE